MKRILFISTFHYFQFLINFNQILLAIHSSVSRVGEAAGVDGPRVGLLATGRGRSFSPTRAGTSSRGKPGDALVPTTRSGEPWGRAHQAPGHVANTIHRLRPRSEFAQNDGAVPLKSRRQ